MKTSPYDLELVELPGGDWYAIAFLHGVAVYNTRSLPAHEPADASASAWDWIIRQEEVCRGGVVPSQPPMIPQGGCNEVFAPGAGFGSGRDMLVGDAGGSLGSRPAGPALSVV